MAPAATIVLGSALANSLLLLATDNKLVIKPGDFFPSNSLKRFLTSSDANILLNVTGSLVDGLRLLFFNVMPLVDAIIVFSFIP